MHTNTHTHDSTHNWREFLESQYRWEQRRVYRPSAADTTAAAWLNSELASGPPSSSSMNVGPNGTATEANANLTLLTTTAASTTAPDNLGNTTLTTPPIAMRELQSTTDYVPDPHLKRIFDEELCRLRNQELERIQSDNEQLEKKLQQLQQSLAAHQARREAAENMQKQDRKQQDARRLRGAEGAVYTIHQGGSSGDPNSGAKVGPDAATSKSGRSVFNDRNNGPPTTRRTPLSTHHVVERHQRDGLDALSSSTSAASSSSTDTSQGYFDVSTPYSARSSQDHSNELYNLNGSGVTIDESLSSSNPSPGRGRLELLLRSREREEQARRLAAQHCRTLLAEIGVSALPTDKLAVIARQPFEPLSTQPYASKKRHLNNHMNSLSSPASQLHSPYHQSPPQPSTTHSPHLHLQVAPNASSTGSYTPRDSGLGLPVASVYLPTAETLTEVPTSSSSSSSSFGDLRNVLSAEANEAHRRTYISASRALSHAAHRTGFADAFTEVLLAPGSHYHSSQGSPSPSSTSNGFPSFQPRTSGLAHPRQ